MNEEQADDMIELLREIRDAISENTSTLRDLSYNQSNGKDYSKQLQNIHQQLEFIQGAIQDK